MALALPARPASFARFGFQAGAAKLAELDAIADAGGTYARMQPSWEGVENFETGDLALPKVHKAALQRCAERGIAPILVAGYGPPRKVVAELTLARDAVPGFGKPPVYQLEATEDVSNLQPRFDFARVKNKAGQLQFVTARDNYYGTVIDAVSGRKFTLGSKLVGIRRAGEKIVVQRLRHEPLFYDDPAHPGVDAFLRYATFLADEIAWAGCPEGYVCLWNEDPWEDDDWNHGYKMWDADRIPADVQTVKLLTPIGRAALGLTLPDGVRFIYGGTDTNGANSLVWNAKSPPSAEQIAASVSFEGVHDYGQNPESQAWDPATFTMLNPEDASANIDDMARHHALAGTGMRVASTECGFRTPNDERQALWLLRRVLSHWGQGISITSIYALSAAAGDFGVLRKDGTPRHAYGALARLAELVATLDGDGGCRSAVPVLLDGGTLPFPLLTTAVYGKQGALLFAWQRTFRPSKSVTWESVAPPTPGPVTFTLPYGCTASGAVDLLTGAAAAFEVGENRVTLPTVGEAPIALKIGG